MKKKHFIFPGQGSQSVGMLPSIIDTEIAKEYFSKTNSAIGYNLIDICNNGPEEILTQTKNTQPAIFTLSIIIDSMLKDNNIEPISVAGHSLGEYSALVSNEVLSFEDALDLIIIRSTEMEKANTITKGSMAAVLNADDEELEKIINGVDGVLVVANYNTTSQVVISGEKKSILDAVEFSKELSPKIKCIELNVSGAFHSPLMKFAREVLSNAINVLNFNDASVPIYQNINAKPTKDADTIKKNLISQLESPVQWFQTINHMIGNSKQKLFIECGPGNVLKGLNRRISRDISTISVNNLNDIESVRIL
tara:strand:+ start:17989 stop:18912 length:924 start_codon:yes stop_codon:yes gene_type:complete